MRLSEFIRKNSEQIAAEWQAFALTCSPAADTMTELALRDHIVEMLDAIATDLDTVQSAADQDQKAKGKLPGARLRTPPQRFTPDFGKSTGSRWTSC